MSNNTIIDDQVNYKPLWLGQFASLVTILLAFFMAVCSTGIARKGVLRFEQGKRSLQRSFGATGNRSLAVVSAVPARHDVDSRKAFKDAQRAMVNTDVKLYEIPGGYTLTIPEKMVFNSGTADLSPAARYILDKISLFANNGTYKMVVEGHTDNIPVVSQEIGSNRKLSLKRAIQVAHYVQIRSGIDGRRIFPVGFGDTRPCENNATTEGREMNRRVVIKLYY